MKLKKLPEALQAAEDEQLHKNREDEQFAIAESCETCIKIICVTTVSAGVTLTVVGFLFKAADALRQSSNPGAAAWLSILGVLALIALTGALAVQAKEMFCPKPQPNSPQPV